MSLLDRVQRAIDIYLHTPEPSPTPVLAVVQRADRRRSARVELEALLTAETEDGRRYSGYCRDLSGEGTAALIYGELEIGQRILLAVHNEHKTRPTVLRAVVRQNYGLRYGLEFCDEQS